MINNPLLARFAGEAALVDPAQAGRVEACLNAIATHAEAEKLMASTTAGPDYWAQDGGWCRPYVVVDGILQIPVKGVLLNNFAYQLYDWATGYDYIWQAFKRGCADFAIGEIKGIAFLSDSPGGMVAGCWDNVDRMVALKASTGVPVRAWAHESAYSAAYGTICFADHITVSRTGGVGSIGTVTGHLDRSGAMKQAGLVFTYIASDPSKVEGNSYEPLSEGAKARIQSRIDELNAIFVSAVARGRGLEESVIRDDLKAHTYTATQAVSNGLADAIGTLEDATSAFAGFLDDQSEQDGDETMTTPVTAVDQTAIDTAVSAALATAEATHTAALAAAVTAERTRISAILGSEEAADRGKQASFLALKSSMSAEDAVAMLKESAKEVASVPAPESPSFEQAMDSTQQPNVGADPDKGGKEKAEDDGSDVLALISGAGISGFRQRAA